MKKLLSLLNSMKTMAALMLVFAVSIGYATIVENDFGTMTAKAEIYNTRWFEILLGLLAINLVLNIYKYKMYTLKKAPIFIFHIAFLVILFGAAVTRYVGYEGTMHIREGLTSSSILSSDVFFEVEAKKGDKEDSYSQPVYLSKRLHNYLGTTLNVDDKKVNIKLVEYIPNAIESIVVDPSGKPMANLMITGGGQGKPVALQEGSYYDVGNFVLDFNSGASFDKPTIKMFVENEKLYMKHDMELGYFKMSDQEKGELSANDKEVFNKRVLYSTDLGNFVLREFIPHAVKKIISDPNANAKSDGLDVLRFNVSVDRKTKEILAYGRKGVEGVKEHVNIDGVDIYVSFGSKEIPLPFKIKLLDFQLDRYPGSMSPASYASEVELIDDEKGIHMPYRIYMNNILEHRGYRFFQASYDRDEKGTVLSVNHDPGTLPTYIGYFLLALGMFWSLFSKQHRFSKLASKVKKASEAKIVPALLAIGMLFSLNTQLKAEEINPAVKTILSFDKDHSEKFGELIVQDTQGRMKPIDTLSTEIMAKIHRSSSLKVGSKQLDANQVVLGMMIRPDIYRDIKLIRTGDEKINEAIGAKKDAKYVSFSQFFQDPIKYERV
jgi:hypothetical protein